MKKVLELLRDPEHWTQHCGARDINNNPIAFDEDGAVRWCLLGAMSKTLIRSLEEEKFRDWLELTHHTENLAEYNDNHTHTEFIAMLEQYIGEGP